MTLTAKQIKKIEQLRYRDGLTQDQTAELVGCVRQTVYRYAPGRPGKIPVAPLREAFDTSHRTAADVARHLGWLDRGNADSSRVKRMLGILPDVTGKSRRISYRTVADAETVGLAAEALGIMPWEVGA